MRSAHFLEHLGEEQCAGSLSDFNGAQQGETLDFDEDDNDPEAEDFLFFPTTRSQSWERIDCRERKSRSGMFSSCCQTVDRQMYIGRESVFPSGLSLTDVVGRQ